MRKGAFLLAILLAASGPALAATKKSKDTKAKPAAQEVDLNANTWKLLRDGWPLILPTSLQVLYFSTHQETASAEPAKPAKPAKSKKK